MYEKARSKKKAKTVVLVTLASIFAFGPSLLAGRAGGQEAKDGREADALYARALSAVGFIYLRDSRTPEERPWRPKACAVVVRRDGVVVTGYRAICRDNSDNIYDEIFFELPKSGPARSTPTRRYRLHLALIDKSYDLALLRAVPEEEGGGAAKPFDLPSLALADSLRAQLLDELAIIGSAEKNAPRLSIQKGAVEGIDLVENWIKTDARLLGGGLGIAVTSDGKLLGIPAKVIVDSQAIDQDGDGRPDAVRRFGAVAFLRPAHLVASMLDRLGDVEAKGIQSRSAESLASSPAPPARSSGPAPLVAVKGLVRSALNGKPIAGARVGLLAAGSNSVTSATLFAWGGSNAEGRFNMNRPVPPGRYKVRAAALGYESLTLDVDISEKPPPLVIELRRPL